MHLFIIYLKFQVLAYVVSPLGTAVCSVGLGSQLHGTVDRKMVEKMQFLICTSHTIYANPIRIRIQIFTTLTQHNLVCGGLVFDIHRLAKTPIEKHATVHKPQHLDIQPSRTKWNRMIVMIIWIISLKGFTNIACKVQMKKLIFSTTFLFNATLIWPKNRENGQQLL